jgi:hypothetical protein
MGIFISLSRRLVVDPRGESHFATGRPWQEVSMLGSKTRRRFISTVGRGYSGPFEFSPVSAISFPILD